MHPGPALPISNEHTVRKGRPVDRYRSSSSVMELPEPSLRQFHRLKTTDVVHDRDIQNRLTSVAALYEFYASRMGKICTVSNILNGRRSSTKHTEPQRNRL